MTAATAPAGAAVRPAATAPAYRIDGRPAAEAAFYAVACDPRRSAIVQACAGAGKTWMLVSRILRALLDGVEPQHILAITFTRKAAGEMRERLEDWLHDYAAADLPHAERVAALRLRGLDEAEAERLAPALRTLHARLLQGGRAVEVFTFHAWFQRLLGHAPLAVMASLGLPARYDTVEDMETLREPLFQRFHRVVQRDPALAADYRALVRRHRRHTVLLWLSSAWRRGPELLRADAAGRADGTVVGAAAMWPDCEGLDDPAAQVLQPPLADELRALAAGLGRSANATPRQAADRLVDALAQAEPAAALEAALHALTTERGTPRRHLGSEREVDAAIDALRGVQRRVAQQTAADDHQALLRLARVLLQEYAALKRQRGLVDMNDLERAAEALLGDSALAGWVQERLDQRVRQVLVDEFQDTSPVQWQVLDGWLSSYAGAGGGPSGAQAPTVFIVGDPKQSIYRFRGAEPRVFDAAQALVVDGLGGHALACDHTRRNAPAVLDALNAVFADAAQVDGWGPFRPHTTAARGEDGHVRRLPGVDRPPARAPRQPLPQWRDTLTEPRLQAEQRLRDAEAEGAAQAVRALIERERLAPGEIMVLARRRVVLADVAVALARHGVPHAVAEPLALQESPEVLDLVAVLDVLASPGHDLALARALRSPLFGADDAALLTLARAARAAGRPWLPTLMAAVPGADADAAPAGGRDGEADGDPGAAAASPEAVAESARAIQAHPLLQRARRLFAGWSALAPHTAPHDLLDRICADADVVARVAAAVPAARRAGALQAVDALLAASLAKGGGRFSTVYGFVREVRAGRLRTELAAPADAVQLLTVHGAKGLEARAVVVVDCDPQRRIGERGLLLVQWPVARPHPERVAFVHSEAQVPPSLQEAWAEEAEAELREELNGLYVAMTRAQQWLVFSRTAPRTRTPGVRSWWERVHDHAAAWEPASDGPMATPDGASGGSASVGTSPGAAGGADRAPAVGPGAGTVPTPPGEAASRAAADPRTPLPSSVSVPVLPAFAGLPAGAPASAFAPLQVAGSETGQRDTPVQRLGRAVHRLIGWLSQPAAASWDGATRRHAAAQAAGSLGLPPTDAEPVEAMAAAVLASPAAARFFAGPALRWARNDVPVVLGGRPARIDRLVALADGGADRASPASDPRRGAGAEGGDAGVPVQWWVLDYKLQSDPMAVPAHREHLAALVRAVRALHPGEPVRGAFVTGGRTGAAELAVED